MKNKKLLRYIGIVLIVLPFIGVYQYMKDIIYIGIGIVLILSIRSNRRDIQSNTPVKIEQNESIVFPKIASGSDVTK